MKIKVMSTEDIKISKSEPNFSYEFKANEAVEVSAEHLDHLLASGIIKVEESKPKKKKVATLKKEEE